MSFAVMTAIVTILSIGTPTAQAQTTTAVDQSTFQQQLATAPWALTEGMDGSLTFTDNGNNSTGYGAGFIPDYPQTTLWNMSILFNGDTATVTAQTSLWSPTFNWSIPSTMGSSAPVSSLLFGITYQAPDVESITISDIAVNGGTPLADTVFADQNDQFGGLSVNNDGAPITSVSYDMTVYFENPALYNSEDALASTMLSTVATETASVPEPGTWQEIVVGLGAIGAMRRWKKI